LGFLLLVSLYLLTRLIEGYLKKEFDNSFERISEKVQHAVNNPKRIPIIVKDIATDLKSYLSLWGLSRVLSLVILSIATVLGGIIAIQQNKLLKNQNGLFEVQNDYIAEELEKINEQTELLKLQTDLFRTQNKNVEKQTDLFGEQNKLVCFQNNQIDTQIGLMGTQNSLLFGQNSRIDTQNYRINIQNNLIEADRRSSLIFLMSNILDRVNEEVKVQKLSVPYGIDNDSITILKDNFKFHLSNPLIGRIIALSRAFRPYKLLAGDTLSTELVSPERGQLSSWTKIS